MIVERLKTILTHFELTPSSFADAIGVPRSSISHLLSGRNKPSLDFVLKLVDTFPEVGLYWLLHGKGTFPPSEDASNEIGATVRPSKTNHMDTFPPSEERKVSKIAVFYEDGTFETYRPKK